jgi:hypothetical protein
LAFPDWRTTPQVSPGDLMVDRVVLVCRGAYAFTNRVNRADVIAALIRGRTPFEGRLPQGYRWIGDGDGRLRLRSVSQQNGWLINVRLVLNEPTAAEPERVVLAATVDINPTRVRALLPDADPSRATITRVALPLVEESQRNRLNNQLSAAQLLHPGAEYNWIDDAALMLDGTVALVALALFGTRPTGQPPIGRGQFTTVSLKQIEIYSDLQADNPVGQLQHFHTGVQRGSRTEFNSVRIGDDSGYRTVTVPVLPTDTTNAVFYSRGDDRIRAEVRYLRNVSRSVRRSSSGDMRQRLRLVADDAARRLNRILDSSRASRRQMLLVGASSFGELAALICEVVDGYERRRAIINRLCQFHHIHAGRGRLAIISTQEAGRLVTRGVIVRAPNRSRDPDGTVYGLHSRFPHLPGGISTEGVTPNSITRLTDPAVP